MPSGIRLADTGSGYVCHFPPTPAIGASPDAVLNGIAVACLGDSYAPRACRTFPAPR